MRKSIWALFFLLILGGIVNAQSRETYQGPFTLNKMEMGWVSGAMATFIAGSGKTIFDTEKVLMSGLKGIDMLGSFMKEKLKAKASTIGKVARDMKVHSRTTKETVREPSLIQMVM